MPKELFQGKMTSQTIREFWNNLAEKYDTDPTTTIRDIHFKYLEIDEIRKFLQPEDKVLDVGCGNGLQTIHYSQDVKEITGIDFAEKMIDVANKIASQFPDESIILKNNLKFAVGDILNINFQNNSFDKVIVERVLINLPTKEDQIKAVSELYRVCKTDGLVIMVESTKQGHDRVDFFRKLFDLGPIQKHANNLYIDEIEFMDILKGKFNIVEVKRFGMYHFISKVLYPLFIHPEEQQFNSKFNELARKIGSKITDFEGCSHHVMFILKAI